MATMIAPARRVKSADFETQGRADAARGLQFVSPEERPVYEAIAAGLASFLPGLVGDGLVYGLTPDERGVLLRASDKAYPDAVTPWSPWVAARKAAAMRIALKAVLDARPRYDAIPPVTGGRELPASAPAASVADSLVAKMRASAVAARLVAPEVKAAKAEAEAAENAAFQARQAEEGRRAAAELVERQTAGMAKLRAEQDARRAAYAEGRVQVSCLSWAYATLADQYAPARFKDIATDLLNQDSLLGERMTPPVMTDADKAEVAALKAAARPKPAAIHPMNHPARLRTASDDGHGWPQDEIDRMGRRAGYSDCDA